MNFSICSFNNSQVTGVICNLPEHNFDSWPERGRWAHESQSWWGSLVLCPAPTALGFWLFHAWSNFILTVTLGIGHNCCGFTPEKTEEIMCPVHAHFEKEKEEKVTCLSTTKTNFVLTFWGSISFQALFLLFHLAFLHNHVPVRKFSLRKVTFKKLCRLCFCFQSLSHFWCWRGF